ncbi:MAG: hypothetical protein QN229_00450 [Desulfurococcaceae archaeon TW002]
MSHECIQVLRGTPWLDTVDQEHIPLEIINSCKEDIIIDFKVLGLPDKEIVYRSSNVKVLGLGKYPVEVITDKYYDILEVYIVVKNKEHHTMSVEVRLK